MATYIVYDKSSGKIHHVHREIMAESGETVELEDRQVIDAVKDLLPKGAEVAVAATEEHPKPVRGHNYYIDLNTGKLMSIERMPKERKKKR